MRKSRTMFVHASGALVAFGLVLAVGCTPEKTVGVRVPALDDALWAKSEWISAKDAPVYEGEVREGTRAADGTSWFVSERTNSREVVKATWMTSGLGVYELYVNGRAIGSDFLKPGFTHVKKTRLSFTYDVTEAMRLGEGEANVFSAEVSAGWWRDKIVTPRGAKGFTGRKSAFRGVLKLDYADGTSAVFGTTTKDWRAGTRGPVLHAAIFDGEEYDAREVQPFAHPSGLDAAEANTEFKGVIVPTDGAEVCLRWDLAMRRGPYALKKGETLVVDFGQNCAAVPAFRFRAKAGTVLTCLPGEMLNDADKGQRGCDGPKGSVYRENLRAGYKDGRLVKYTFAGEGWEMYHPRFTFFGYRYVALSATEDVEIDEIVSVPVTSIRQDLELGTIETGDKDVNRLIQNVVWGQRSNYLSVPTDCPQRNERLGWTADTQAFCETGTFNADTVAFFHKWMRDMRDTQDPRGGFPGVAPWAQYGACEKSMMRIAWADAGIIVPYQIWKQFGDRSILDENWAAMDKFMSHVNETKYEHTAIAAECGDYQWADWLSFEKLESCGGSGNENDCAFYWGTDAAGKRVRLGRPERYVYWDYLGGCFWLWDAQMMETMARATGRDAAKYARMVADARAYLRVKFFATEDGCIIPLLREMQTPAVFALKLGLVEGEAKAKTIRELRANVARQNGCLKTGFVGTSILMDTLTECGMNDLAYSILLNHNFPGWLYSVDQGATTVWERWNSYTKEHGFGPVGMNSFNHYAYGSVLAWIYKTVAGIAADPADPGFRTIVMAPVPDRRLGSVTASYRSAAGLIKSSWEYKNALWVWRVEIPTGAKAKIRLPGEEIVREYGPGSYVFRKEGLK